MTTSRRILWLLALVFGVIGVVGCVSAVAGLWQANVRLRTASAGVHKIVDDSLVSVQDVLARAQVRVDESKLTVEDVETTLTDWTKREVSEQLTDKLDLEQRTTRLASTFSQASEWLDVSESSMQFVQRALLAAQVAGVSVDAQPVDQLLVEIGKLRGHLADANDMVQQIRDRTTDDGGEQVIRERIAQAAQLASRLLATFGVIDTGLATLNQRLTDAHSDISASQTTVSHWISIATWTTVCLIAWIAAGQFCMCMLGWRGFRSPSGVDDADAVHRS